jgi:hypothetical protein
MLAGRIFERMAAWAMLKRVRAFWVIFAALGAVVCSALELSGVVRGYAVIGMILLMLASWPADLAEMRRRWKLEELAEAWWRKEMSEDDLKRTLAAQRIGRIHFSAMDGALRRRFGKDFSQAFEARFLPEAEAPHGGVA